MKHHELLKHIRSHAEISNILAIKICKDLGIPPI